MTILFVLLTFLLIMAITYYTDRRQPEVRPAVLVGAPPAAKVVRDSRFDIPKGYRFHPGHTWVVDEGFQNARVGVDSFAVNLLGAVDKVEVPGLNRWVRQGQKICSLSHEGVTVDLVSPVEGTVVAVNQAVLKDPGILCEQPYQEGWVCMVQSPDLAINLKNLLGEALVAPWVQNSIRRLRAMTPQLSGATAQDGGLPMPGVLTQVDPAAQRAMIKEFFLT